MADKSMVTIPFRVPWFIYDLYNHQLITSPTVPGDIADSKQVIFAETPIPGLMYQPVNQGGAGNRKLSLSIPLIKRNGSIGNVLMVKQFERLRCKGGGIFRKTQKFTPNPKVLYSWGTGSVPLEWFVSKCDFVHKGDGWVNQIGNPQMTTVQLELILDETSVLYQVEEIWRELASYIGMVYGVVDIVRANLGEAVM